MCPCTCVIVLHCGQITLHAPQAFSLCIRSGSRGEFAASRGRCSLLFQPIVYTTRGYCIEGVVGCIARGVPRSCACLGDLCTHRGVPKRACAHCRWCRIAGLHVACSNGLRCRVLMCRRRRNPRGMVMFVVLCARVVFTGGVASLWFYRRRGFGRLRTYERHMRLGMRRYPVPRILFISRPVRRVCCRFGRQSQAPLSSLSGRRMGSTCSGMRSTCLDMSGTYNRWGAFSWALPVLGFVHAMVAVVASLAPLRIFHYQIQWAPVSTSEHPHAHTHPPPPPPPAPARPHTQTHTHTHAHTRRH